MSVSERLTELEQELAGLPERLVALLAAPPEGREDVQLAPASAGLVDAMGSPQQLPERPREERDFPGIDQQPARAFGPLPGAEFGPAPQRTFGDLPDTSAFAMSPFPSPAPDLAPDAVPARQLSFPMMPELQPLPQA